MCKKNWQKYIIQAFNMILPKRSSKFWLTLSTYGRGTGTMPWSMSDNSFTLAVTFALPSLKNQTFKEKIFVSQLNFIMTCLLLYSMYYLVVSFWVSTTMHYEVCCPSKFEPFLLQSFDMSLTKNRVVGWGFCADIWKVQLKSNML